MFEVFIITARTDRDNLMCSLVVHDKIHSNYEDGKINLEDIR